MDRDPCPYRIFDDVGGAFALGAGGGTVWHLVKGWRNSPRGERMMGPVFSPSPASRKTSEQLVERTRNALHARRSLTWLAAFRSGAAATAP